MRSLGPRGIPATAAAGARGGAPGATCWHFAQTHLRLFLWFLFDPSHGPSHRPLLLVRRSQKRRGEAVSGLSLAGGACPGPRATCQLHAGGTRQLALRGLPRERARGMAPWGPCLMNWTGPLEATSGLSLGPAWNELPWPVPSTSWPPIRPQRSDDANSGTCSNPRRSSVHAPGRLPS